MGTPQTAIRTPATTHFSVASSIVGNNWKCQPKIHPPTPSTHPPTPSNPRGPISTLLDPGGPHQTPQTAIRTPATAHFSVASSIVGNNWKCQPKIHTQKHKTCTHTNMNTHTHTHT